VFKRRTRKDEPDRPQADQAWSVSWRLATYLGGLGVGAERSLGTLWFTEEAIGLGGRKPSEVVIPLSEVARVEVRDRPAPATGRTALGWRGAGSTKSSTITVFTTSGSSAVFRVLVSAASSRAVAGPFLQHFDIPLHDELPRPGRA
jgi:hypothetical protein